VIGMMTTSLQVRQLLYRLPQHLRAMSNALLSARVNAGARCRGAASPDDWFPAEPVGDSGRAAYEATAREKCAGCPVSDACLLLTLRAESGYAVQPHGISGGLAPWERKSLLRAIQRRGLSIFPTARSKAVAS
jgi:hypothetical protein